MAASKAAAAEGVKDRAVGCGVRSEHESGIAKAAKLSTMTQVRFESTDRNISALYVTNKIYNHTDGFQLYAPARSVMRQATKSSHLTGLVRRG